MGATGPSFTRTIVVSPTAANTAGPSGAQAIANGTALASAVSRASGAAGTDNRYVVLVEPGEYDLQGNELQLGSDVDLKGLGADSTTLESSAPTAVAMQGSDPETVSDLSIDDGQAADVTGLSVGAAGSTVRNVDVTVSGGVSAPTTFAIQATAAATLIDVNASATSSYGTPVSGTAAGLYATAPVTLEGGSYVATPQTTDAAEGIEAAAAVIASGITASGATASIDVTGASVFVRNSVVTGGPLDDRNTSGTLSVAGSEVPDAITGSGPFSCIGDYTDRSGILAAVGSQCI